MAIATYSDLVTSIGAWIHRTDLAAVIPDFIRLAESRMQNEIDIRQLDNTATLTTVAGTSTVALPADFNQLRACSVSAGGETIILDVLSPDILLQRWGSYVSAMPRSYAVRGGNLLLGPTPDAAYSMSIEYYSTIPGLSGTNTTNAVLTAYPEMYLHCCLIFAAQYTRDAELGQSMEQLYAADIARINAQNWGQMATMAIKAG